MSKKAPTFTEEMNCEKYTNPYSMIFVWKVLQRRHTGYSHDNISEQLVWNASTVPSAVGKGISRFHVDRNVCKGSTDTPKRGNVQDRNDLETQE